MKFSNFLSQSLERLKIALGVSLRKNIKSFQQVIPHQIPWGHYILL